jgi:2Fe-2S ferredoxin
VVYFAAFGGRVRLWTTKLLPGFGGTGWSDSLMGKIVVTDRAGETHEIEVSAGDNIMEPLRDLDDGVEALCGGMCSCATCHIFVDPDWFAKLDPAQDDELELLEETECYREEESRLSCQVEYSDDLDGMRFTIAPEE